MYITFLVYLIKYCLHTSMFVWKTDKFAGFVKFLKSTCLYKSKILYVEFIKYFMTFSH